MQLAIALKQIFPDADFLIDIILRDDGSGAYIAQWNLPDPQPTPAELDAAWTAWEAGQTGRDLLEQQQVDATAFTDLPEWASYTTAEAVAAIHAAILGGDTLAQAQAKVDTLPNTIAGMKTGLKEAAKEFAAVRGILEKMAKVQVYLRDRTIISIVVALSIWIMMASRVFAQGPGITVITSTLEAEPGFIFAAPGPPSALIIMSNQGYPVFSRNQSQPYDFKRQGDSLTFFNSSVGRFEVLNRDYALVDTWQAVGYDTDVHDLQILDSGAALLLVYREFPYDMSLIVPGGSPTATVISCVVQEINPDKSLAWEWDSFDYLPITQTNRSLTANRIDYAHCNAVEQDDDGNILVSHRHLDEVTKVDRQTSAVIWRLGGQGNEFTFANDTGFSLQHDIRRIANGHITLFDNGQSSRGYSRAVEYEIDEVSKVITKTWEFHGPFANCCGSVQRLEENTLISFGSGHPTIIEVNRQGEIVFAADVPFTYRSFKFPWVVKYYLPAISTRY